MECTDPVELKRQITLARTEIKNLRQQISGLKHEHLKETNLLKSILDSAAATGSVSSATTSRQSLPDTHNSSIVYRPIGHIETVFNSKRAVPRQPSVSGDCRGCVVLDSSVYNNPEHAVDGLEEFSHMWVLFHMHATESNSVPAKVCPPRLRGERRGVLATRSPHRQCPIGLSLVKILSVEGNRIFFSGVDMVNGTPVLDIKPYIPQYDMPSATRPPAEGVGDSPGPIRMSPRPADVTGYAADHSLHSPDGTLGASSAATPLSPSPNSPGSVDLLDGIDGLALASRSPLAVRPPTERGAPDGQERFTPPQSAHLADVRVPRWITNPPQQPLEVIFSNEATSRLTELIGDRAEVFRSNLECLLSEDPRSQYVRSRYPNDEYSCVLEDLSIGCYFEDGVCTVVAVRNAEDMQS